MEENNLNPESTAPSSRNVVEKTTDIFDAVATIKDPAIIAVTAIVSIAKTITGLISRL